MKKIISSLFLAAFLFSLNAVIAQPPKGNPGFKEIRTYFNENVKPELTKQQAKFLSSLSDKEIAELQKIKEQWKDVREQMHGQVKPEDRENTQKAHFSAFSAQVEKIADAHPQEKEDYIKTMKTKKEQWQKDITAIREKNDLPEPKWGNKFMERIDDPAFILMYDPNKSFKPHNKKPGMGMNKGMNKKPGMAKQVNEPAIKVFPYPAETTVSIRITGAKDKNIKANVYDPKGKKVQELYNGPSSLPVLNFSLDVSKWDEGFYTVKVKFDDRGMSNDFKVIR